ncbi:MAG: glycosyl transferase in large core assembly cluster [Ilumatobacteraceae bacterium]|nr:glycosyl transferase in large core assembly cluster [Ilumatobacteraceae bacterium]
MLVRVLILTETSGLYGAERWTAAVANGLSRRGMQVTLARPVHAGEASLAMDPEVGLCEFNVFSQIDPLGWVTDRSLAATIIDAEQPDVALVSCGSVLSCMGARQELLQRGIPYISVSHLGGQPGFDLPCPAWLRDQAAEVLNGASTCIGVSNDVVASLRADFGLSDDRGRAVLNGRPDEFFLPVDDERRRRLRAELGMDEQMVMVLTVARVHPNKGYQFQLEAMEVLRHRPIWDRLRFVWVGGTEAQRRLRALVIARGVTGNVQLLGHREDVVDLLGAADIFVLPSRQEAAPLAIVEAMAAGLAIITTPVNGIPDLVGRCAVMVADPNDEPAATARELAIEIEALAADPQRRSELGRAAHERASLLWREDRMIDEYQRLIEHR